ncbi:feruloyl esterase [Fusarium pseudoanthophilum]|uniref:Feruloyl esterase n=1 Tax=Fusarium pseudoanthophilum TaxID=48495 RepID=A0A8H5KV23_9HYPO|nr:feruloyl esterase [Fusarium pseudoanthophilum]
MPSPIDIFTADTTVPKLVTVIITTSPTPSAPSTELVSAVLKSFEEHCHALTLCDVIFVFDTFDQIVPTARLKKGQVTPQQAADFDEYKKNIKELILTKYRHVSAEFTQRSATAEYGSPNPQNTVDYTISQTSDKKVTFIEPLRRLGFGLAVRSALRVTQTPFVWVQQHDWALVADFPVAPLVQIMKAHDSHPETPIKYICLAAIRMLSHAISEQHPVLRELSSSLTQKYEDPTHPGVKIPLTPIYFWHDKPHLASTAHYLERVFPSRLAMLRGDFIEDKIGQRARAQMKEGLRGMKPALYPRRLQERQLFFPISHKNLADATTVNESEGSETEPFIPTPENPQTNHMTRKHPAKEPLFESSPKQPRRQGIAVSATAGNNTELLSTDCDLISELEQYRDGEKDSFWRCYGSFSSSLQQPSGSLLLIRFTVSSLVARLTASSQRPSRQRSGPLRTASKQKRRYKNVQQGFKQLYPEKALMLGFDSYAGSTSSNIKQNALQAEDPQKKEPLVKPLEEMHSTHNILDLFLFSMHSPVTSMHSDRNQ